MEIIDLYRSGLTRRKVAATVNPQTDPPDRYSAGSLARLELWQLWL